MNCSFFKKIKSQATQCVLLLCLAIALLFSVEAQAQFVPQGFNYQCVVRDDAGQAMANMTVNLLFAVKSGSPNGPVAYAESQTLSTNEFGLTTTVIGEGIPVQGDFAAVNWGGGAKYITVSIETNPGVFDELGTSEFQSVPYALYALSSANGGTGGDDWGSQSVETGPTLSGNGTLTNPINIAQQGAQTGQVLKWDGSKWVPQDDISNSGMNGGTVTQINTGNGLVGGPITTNGTIELTPTGVTPGAYGSATEIPVITIDANGRITNVWKAVPSPGTVGIAGAAGIDVQQQGTNFTITNTGDTNPNDDIRVTSQANGDIEGTFSNLQIQSGAVTTAEILNQTIRGIDINKMDAMPGEVLKWNGSIWLPQVDENTGISGVTIDAGTGISVLGSTDDFTITNTGDTDASDDLLVTDIADGDIEGTFDDLQLKTAVVETIHLANGAVTTAKLVNNAISTPKIRDAAVTAEKLNQMGAAVGEVLKWDGTEWVADEDQVGNTLALSAGVGIDITGTAPDLMIVNTGDTDASDDLTDASIADGDVVGTFDDLQIQAEVVTTLEILDETIQEEDIADAAVSTAKVENAAITTAKIRNLAVTTGKLANEAVTTTKIADDAITTIKIDNNAITTAKIRDMSVDSDKIANAAITAEKLDQMGASTGEILKWNGTAWTPAADLTATGGGGTVTYSAGSGIRITGTAPDFTIENTGDVDASDDLTSATLYDGDVSGTFNDLQLQNNTVQSSNIVNGAIKNADIGDREVEGSKIAAMNAQLGQVLKWTGTTWSPSDDNTGGGTGGSNWTLSGQNLTPIPSGNILIGQLNNNSGRLQVTSTNTSQEAGVFKIENNTSPKTALFVETSGSGIGGFFSSRNGPALVTGNGFVGVGTANPEGQVHIVSNTASQLVLGGDMPRIEFNNSNPTAYIQQEPSNLLLETVSDTIGIALQPNGQPSIFANPKSGSVGIGAPSTTNHALNIFHTDQGMALNNIQSDHFWEFWTSDDGSLVLYNDQLPVGVPAGIFSANGSYNPSDKRLKDDIRPITDVLKKIAALPAVSYHFKGTDGRTIGFVAQDVEAAFPDLVTKTPVKNGIGGYLAVNYNALTAVAMQAVREQQTEINTLKEENETLKARLDAIEARLDALEKR